MERDVAAYQRWVSSRFYASQRHTTEVKYIKFMDELAMLLGASHLSVPALLGLTVQ